LYIGVAGGPDGIVLTAASGVVKSPNFGTGDYPFDTDCTWVIESPTDFFKDLVNVIRNSPNLA
jgi:hypothetical protein